MNTLDIVTTQPSRDYELIDSGLGEKLERYGDIIVCRPDPQALWHKNLSQEEWDKADATFSRDALKAKWHKKPNVPDEWPIELGDLKLWVSLTAFKHTGLFPEQESNWQWTRELIEKATTAGRKISVLNLFGYTGGATLAAAKAGAEVCHVDGSKAAVTWARENAELSGLAEKSIRWILDDARTFVLREVGRGNKYDAIIMDPPAFGHGPKKELWKIENDFLPFLDSCKKILSDNPLFILINGYASGYSAIGYENNLVHMMHEYGGSLQKGELTIKESRSDRLLPSGIFARWQK